MFQTQILAVVSIAAAWNVSKLWIESEIPNQKK